MVQAQRIKEPSRASDLRGSSKSLQAKMDAENTRDNCLDAHCLARQNWNRAQEFLQDTIAAEKIKDLYEEIHKTEKIQTFEEIGKKKKDGNPVMKKLRGKKEQRKETLSTEEVKAKEESMPLVSHETK
ncbi:hypothetical protein Tco_0324798 [Tanacetum coccineum]